MNNYFIVAIVTFGIYWVTSYFNIFMVYDKYDAFTRRFVSGFFPYSLLFKQKYKILKIISFSFLVVSIISLSIGIILYRNG